MAIEIQEVTDGQLKQVLSSVEGHFLDIKGKDIQPAKLTKSISAFANADGGELYIGIAESGVNLFDLPHRWDGFATPEAANGHLQAFSEASPLGGDFVYEFLQHRAQTGYVLHVTMRKTKGIVRATDGRPYIRTGAQNLPVDTLEKLARLERNKGITSFESEPVSVDIRTVCESDTVMRFMQEVVPTSEPEPWLRKQELIRDYKPTVAGVMLFSDLPQAALPKRTGIKVYRYKSSEAEGEREALVDVPVSVEGCAYDIIKEAVELTVQTIGGIQVLGAAGLEPVVYPKETLHEVITNAVLHRDYSIADDVHVRIFDNRVEVESPGRLPAHITTENILSERFARNGNLVRVINKFPDPPNKDVGEGLNTAVEAMRRLRLKDPIFRETDNAVVVEIRHERLASAEDLVMGYLATNAEITNRVARRLTGIRSENSMKNVFYRLRERNLIEQVPGRFGFASAWRKKSPDVLAP
jgi:ATP-dependent DNA helicase RecG